MNKVEKLLDDIYSVIIKESPQQLKKGLKDCNSIYCHSCDIRKHRLMGRGLFAKGRSYEKYTLRHDILKI